MSVDIGTSVNKPTLLNGAITCPTTTDSSWTSEETRVSEHAGDTDGSLPIGQTLPFSNVCRTSRNITKKDRSTSTKNDKGHVPSLGWLKTLVWVF